MTNENSENDPYKVYFLPVASKELEKLPLKIQEQLLPVIRSLTHPFNIPSIKLKDRKDTFRVRVGDYRILFKTYSSDKIVVILKISHRKKAYR